LAEGLGEFGEAVIEQTPIEFDAEVAAGLARKEARLAKIAAMVEAQAAAPMMPVARKAKAA
jgi:hypothetical protein